MQPENLTLPSGETVSLRGLSGYEFTLSTKIAESDPVAISVQYLRFAMDLSEAGAEQWMRTHTAGDFNAAFRRVRELSGLVEGADKSDVDQVGVGSG